MSYVALENEPSKYDLDRGIAHTPEEATFLEVLREVTGTGALTSQKAAKMVYDNIMSGEVRLNDLSEERLVSMKPLLEAQGIAMPTQEDIKIDYAQFLDGADKLLSDANEDGIVTKAEYTAFTEPAPLFTPGQYKEPFKLEMEHTILIVAALVCITWIITVWIKRKNA